MSYFIYYVKKFFFALPFFVGLFFFCLSIKPFLTDPYYILSFDLAFLFEEVSVAALLLFTVVCFLVFATLASDIKLVLPVALLASLIPLVILPSSASVVFAASHFVCVMAVVVLFQDKLNSYITFQPATLLSPDIHNLTTILVLALCVSYFFPTITYFQTNRFVIPDSVVETVLSSLPKIQQLQDLEQRTSQGHPLPSKEQIAQLKQNPQLLEASGITLDQLEEIEQSLNQQATPDNFVKSLVRKQLENLVEPYQRFMPLILTLFLFLSLKSLTSLLSLFLTPFLWTLFFILEKTGYTTYAIETRPVKKLIV